MMNRLSVRTPSTHNNGKLSRLLLAMALLFSGGHAIAADTTVKHDKDWSGSKRESRTWNYTSDDDYPPEDPIKCAANKVMVGRDHEHDENGPTKHLCASLTQNGVALTVSTSAEWEEKYDDESELYEFQCGGNKVMTGRGHWHDENSATWYFCGTVKDAWGDEMQVANRKWSDKFKESYSSYTCPAGTVMTGRSHGVVGGGEPGDENGDTKYQCATLY